MDPKEQELMEIIRTADRCEKLCIMAILFSAPGKERFVRPAGYSNGELKRTIKRLRIAQKDCPDIAKSFEPAITLIRNNWLHKAA